MRTANTTWFSWMLWQVDEGIWCSSLAQRRSWQEATHALAITDLVETLAKMFGAEYDKYFVELLKPVLRFAKPGRSSSDKAMAVGIIGEVSIHPCAPPSAHGMQHLTTTSDAFRCQSTWVARS